MKKVKTVTTNIIENNYTRRTIFRILLGGIIILTILYGYFITSATFNILARRSLENTVQSYNTNIGQLELTYFSSVDKINKSYALANGFVNARNNIFATRSVRYVAIR